MPADSPLSVPDPALTTICDAVLPDIDSEWRALAPARLSRLIDTLPNRSDAEMLRLFARALQWPFAGLLLSGRPISLSTPNLPRREAYLRLLSRHPIGRVRAAVYWLRQLSALAYYADCDEAGRNPVWDEMGYPGPLISPPGSPHAIEPLAPDADTSLQCDVVVVGSGVGGGMAAAELTAAGRDVVVLERGPYVDESGFSGLEIPSLRRLYLGNGLLTTADNGMLVLAGSCLGGGSVVNWTTSFRTPDDVRAEWSDVSGLDLFTGGSFDRSLDAACARLHVNVAHNRLSRRDEILARGLDTLGWHGSPVPRDVEGCTQDDVCGYCGYGCVRGAKCSTLKSCLPGAFRAGARILPDCTAGRVLIRGGQAVGVEARTTSGHAVTVHARAVVVAGGSIETPALLLRSGIGAPVGQYLRLHPVTAVAGRFDEEIQPWTGSIQAYFSNQFADLDGGYGVRFETGPIHPAFGALITPWMSAEVFDASMKDLAHVSVIGILLRDRDAGHVSVTRGGRTVVHYRISGYDRRHLRTGVEEARRILQAAGARATWDVPDLLVTFHQMGSCRMGADPATSVVGERGETHAIRRLYVADASLFPTASGVNPMVTIAALAHHVAGEVHASI